jgi:hypothetical protein
MLIIVKPAPYEKGRPNKVTGKFEARLEDGRMIVRASRTPFCDAARRLLDEGVDPGTQLIMRHAGSETDALRSTVRVAAKLTVDNQKTVFHKWIPPEQRFTK